MPILGPHACLRALCTHVVLCLILPRGRTRVRLHGSSFFTCADMSVPCAVQLGDAILAAPCLLWQSTGCYSTGNVDWQMSSNHSELYAKLVIFKVAKLPARKCTRAAALSRVRCDAVVGRVLPSRLVSRRPRGQRPTTAILLYCCTEAA